MTHPHTGNLAVSGRTFPGLPNGEIEEGQKVEDIRERGVQAVVVDGVVVSDFIEACHCDKTGGSSEVNARRSKRRR